MTSAHRRRILFALMCAFLCASNASAQYTTGRIEGTVQDPTGGAIPGATVTLRNIGTNQTRTQTTDTNGLYAFPAVPAGDYELVAEISGFSRARVTFTMVTNQTVTQKLELPLAGQTETVEVRGELAALLNTSEAQLSITRIDREVRELPNLNRSVVGFASYTPGVQPTQNPRGGSLAIASGSQAGFIAAGGGRARATAVQLDYTDVNDWEFGGIALGTTPMVDAVQEFKVLTSNFSAEHGVKSNGQVIMVTKSGTNSWHGTTYDFVQNDKFNARDYFDRTGKPRPLKRNNYGFTMGGPIVRNRTFLFGGFEGTQTRGASATSIATVPTAAARARATNPAIVSALSLLPTPTAATGNPDIGTVASVFPAPSSNAQFIVKGDHQFNTSHSLSARYLHSHSTSILRFPALNTLPGFDTDFKTYARNLSITDSYVLSSKTINQLRVAYGRSSGLILNEGGLQTPRYTISGLVNFGALNFFPNTRTFDVYQVNDVLTQVRGAHTLKGGADFRKINDSSLLSTNAYGLFTFASLDAFLNAQASSWTQVFGEQNRRFRTSLMGFFVQDDWKAYTNLTFNLGVRWEIQGPITEADGLTSVLDLETPGDIASAGSGPLGTFHVGNPSTRRNAHNVGPRVGFAWTPRTDLVVRGGYGLFYDSFNFTPQTFSRAVPPLNYSFSLVGTQLSGENNFERLVNGTAPIAVAAKSQVGTFGTLRNFGEITTLDLNMPNPYSQHFSIGADLQFLRDFVFHAGYVGTRGSELTVFGPINSVVRRPAPATSVADESARLPEFRAAVNAQNGVGNTRLDPRFDQVSYHSGGGRSIYHSLQTELTKRAAREGLMFRMAYTWSNSMDDGSDFTTEQQANDNNYRQIGSDLHAEWGPSNYDIRHRFVLTTILELPFFRGQQGPLGRVLGGWSWQTANLWQSGVPVTVLAGPRFGIQDVNLDGELIPRVGLDNTRADCNPSGTGFTLGDASTIPPPNQRGVDGAPNTSNFIYTQPLLGNNGRCGRNTLRLNSLTNMDWSFFKRVRLADAGPVGSGPFMLEFRAEFFNIFNTPYLTGQGTAFRTVSSPSFGLLNAAGAARRAQFALKVTW